MNNLNEDILKKAKNKINSMLSERQKADLIEKIKQMDKESVKSMVKNIDLAKVEDPDLRAFIKNFKSEI